MFHEDPPYICFDGRDSSFGRVAPRGTTKPRTNAFRLITISSGEASLAECATAGGAVNRVVTLSGLPFKAQNSQLGQWISTLGVRAAANAGHAGLHFVREVVARRTQLLELLRAEHAQIVDRIIAGGGENVRQAEYLATVELGARVFARVFGFDAPDLADVWAGAQQEVRDHGDEVEALRWLASYVAANSHRVEGLGRSAGCDKAPIPGAVTFAERPASGEQLGVMREGRLCLHIGAFERVMREASFDPKVTLRAWETQGRLVPGDGRHRFPQVRIGPMRPRMVVFTSGTTEELLGTVPDPSAGGGNAGPTS